jgi:crotonobetainyl-CoA:carnitine CoA-transferase CaiB-like acyl-CoA transferase
VALGLLTYPAAWYLSAGIVTERHPLSGHPSMVPFQFIETADGYLALACPKEKFFQELATIIELPGLATDTRFSSFAARRENRLALLEILGETFHQHTTSFWIERLRGRVPCAPVRSLADALDREELERRNMLASYDHQTFGKVQMTGTPFTLDGFQPEYRPAPALNGDQPRILEELGYGEDERRALTTEGAFGSP